MEGKKIVTVPIGDVVPGMMSAGDIYTGNDQLIVQKKQIIDVNTIAKITFFGVLSVQVYINEDTVLEQEEISFISEEEQKRFEKFDEAYEKTIEIVKESMNELLEKGKPIDKEALIKEVENLVDSTGTSYHAFDMLHYVKSYDDEIFSHSLNVAMICNVFSDWLGLSNEDKKNLTLCGLIHDVGKLMVSGEILRKKDKLSESEMKEIQSHPEIGYGFMYDKNLDERIKKAVLEHHERCDGTGYPYGKEIDQIDMYSAITAIADVFEAMTATRVYRAGLSPFRVIKLFERDGKHMFNPAYLMPILNNITNAYLRHKVKLSDGRKGTIIMINQNELSRPIVMIKDNFVDLTKERELSIQEVF